MSCDRQHARARRCYHKDCYSPCDGRHAVGDTCTLSDCAGKDIRGYDTYVKAAGHTTTVRKMWDMLSTVLNFGPPGVTESIRDRQRKRFHRESVQLKRELCDLMRPKIVEFIERWRTNHLPGDE